MKDIVAIGEVLIDFTSEKTDAAGYPTLAAHPGGAPANFLAAATSMGLSAAFIGKVGSDAFGRLLLKTLESKNIATEAVKVTEDAFTTLAFVTLDAEGDREFSFARKPGADSTLTAEDVPEELIAGAKDLHFGSLLMTTESGTRATFRAIEYAEAHGVPVSYDPNYRAPLWDSEERAKKMMLLGAERADIMKISEEEAELLFGTGREEAQDYIFENFPKMKLCMVTLGADGAILRSGSTQVRVAAPKVSVIDTTGAGDICGGSLVAGLLRLDGFDAKEFQAGKRTLTEEELRKIGTYAVWAASKSTEKHGGIDSVPAYEPEKAGL